MTQMMAQFNAELTSYETTAAANDFTVKFNANQYPVKLILEQNEPPIYQMAEDGSTVDVKIKQARITVIGLPEAQVEIEGAITLGKKELNKLINDGIKLVEIYLHGFMQERKEPVSAAR